MRVEWTIFHYFSRLFSFKKIHSNVCLDPENGTTTPSILHIITTKQTRSRIVDTDEATATTTKTTIIVIDYA